MLRRKLTPAEVAKSWGVSPDKVVRFIRSGELKAIDISQKRDKRPRYRIDPADVEAFEAARQVVSRLPTSQTRRSKRNGDIKVYF